MSRACAVIAAVAAIGIAIAGFSAMASAHARVKSSSPAKGEVIQASPSQVEIFFTQAVQKVAGTYGIEVGRDRGAAVTAGPPVIDENDRTHLTVRLQPNLNPGRYVVQWKNVSDEDGDPAEGAFSFYIRSQPNAVDLQNDAQLEQIGAESPEPGATESAGSPTTAPSAATTPAPSGTAARPATTSAAASPTVTSTSPDGGGGDNTLYIILGGVGAAVVIGLGGWWLFMRQRP